MEIIQDDDAELQEGQMTLWEHLEELRRRLIICILTLLVGFVVCWFYRELIFSVVQAPFLKYVEHGDRLSFISLTEPFFVYMKAAAFAAIIFTSPILISQVWFFISPGLKKK
jgi:sec-independent protein translocase protein TatC